MTLNNINSLFKCARLYLIINCRLYIAEQENSLKFLLRNAVCSRLWQYFLSNTVWCE